MQISFIVIVGLDDEDVTQVLPLSSHCVVSEVLSVFHLKVCDLIVAASASYIVQTAAIHAKLTVNAPCWTNRFFYGLRESGLSTFTSENL